MQDQNACGILIKQIHDALEKNANNALRSSGLTMAQVNALMILNDMPAQQLTLKQIEQSMRVAQSTAAGIVSRLEQKKLVESLGDSEDKRIKIIAITSQGKACCQQVEKSMQQWEDNLLSALSDTERDIIPALLRKIRDSIY